MKNKNKPAVPVNYYLKEYFTDITPYSSEHMRDISRFNRLLESLQVTQKNGEDQKAFAEIGSKIRELNSFLISNDIVLTDEEQNEIVAIAGSRLSPAVSKTKIEDIIYRIKNRAQVEILARRETETREKEILDLSYSGLKIIDWLKVALWALEFGTITLFTHRLKDSSLSYLRKRAVELLEAIIKGINPVLDQEYYLLSILEYNSIELFLQIRKSLVQILEIPYSESYAADEIAVIMDSFTELYLKLLHNSSLAEQGLKKAFKKSKAPHGFWGAYYEFMGTPLYNSRPVRMSEFDQTTRTALGVLLSFYTSETGVVVRTANQIMYLNEIDCSLESTAKRLTAGAVRCMNENRPEPVAHGERPTNRSAELDRIVTRFLPQGAAISDLLARHDSKLPAQQWRQENENRPMARIKKIVEGYIRFFIEPLSSNIFVPVYDNKEYSDYFEKKGNLVSIIKNFNLMDFELIGTKEKDFVSLQLPENSTAKQLIFTLTRLEIPKASYDSRMAMAQTILRKISGISYQLALALNDMIKKYHEDKMIIQADVTFNFDFFLGAEIREKEHPRLRTLLKKDSLTLAEFLEDACSVAFYLCAELNHEGVESIRKEFDALQPAQQKSGEDSAAMKEARVSAFTDEDRQMYRDPLTGLMNYQYLLERVVQKLYDGSTRFRFDYPRYTFLIEIDGLGKLNNLWGHDFGDRVLREASKVIADHVYQEGRDENDIVLRYEAGMILGYLNNRSLSSAVDRLTNIRNGINGLLLQCGEGGETVSIAANIGIYQERAGSDLYDNIKIARKILFTANRTGGNRVGFVREQNRIITEKDFLVSGFMIEGIVTAV